ncbi:hypothetical protein CRYUN_Cryun19dG0102100 [Craigia yunnanensis]
MQSEGSNGTSTRPGDHSGNLPEPDLEKQGNIPVLPEEERQSGSDGDSACEANPTLLTIVVMKGESHVTRQPLAKLPKDVDSIKEELPRAGSPKKGYFSRTTSSLEQCRVCQQEKEEGLIVLGCQCKGGLAKAHRSCIDTWFCTKGSNKCEICLQITGFGGLIQTLHMTVKGAVLVHYGWHSQSLLVVYCWMC